MVLDIIIIVVLCGFGVAGLRKGLVGTLFSVFSVLLSLYLAGVISFGCADYIVELLGVGDVWVIKASNVFDYLNNKS